MLTRYIKAAMQKARIEKLESGKFYGEIPQCPGVWAQGATAEKCREELQEVLEEWIVLKLRHGDTIPPINGITLRVRTTQAG